MYVMFLTLETHLLLETLTLHLESNDGVKEGEGG